MPRQFANRLAMTVFLLLRFLPTWPVSIQNKKKPLIAQQLQKCALFSVRKTYLKRVAGYRPGLRQHIPLCRRQSYLKGWRAGIDK